MTKNQEEEIVKIPKKYALLIKNIVEWLKEGENLALRHNINYEALRYLLSRKRAKDTTGALLFEDLSPSAYLGGIPLLRKDIERILAKHSFIYKIGMLHLYLLSLEVKSARGTDVRENAIYKWQIISSAQWKQREVKFDEILGIDDLVGMYVWLNPQRYIKDKAIKFINEMDKEAEKDEILEYSEWINKREIYF